jgi:hypothetical protein
VDPLIGEYKFTASSNVSARYILPFPVAFPFYDVQINSMYYHISSEFDEYYPNSLITNFYAFVFLFLVGS